jgi:septal ring factor EnvC (AmiA/AmiB activator)
MILLQKRTNELESNLTTLKIANDEINSELRSAIDRTNNELQEEKAKYRKLENELSYKDHGVKVLEHELEASRKDLEELR